MTATPHDNAEKNVYWINEPVQFECLMSARRMEMVDQLAQIGTCSVRELAHILGVKTSSLYHHTQKLLGVGLIEEAGVRGQGRSAEKLFRTPGAVMRYGLSIGDPDAFRIYRRLGDYQSRQSARDFARGLQSSQIVDKGPQKNVWIFRLVGAPDSAALAEINSHIEQIAQLFWRSAGQDNPLVVLSAIMAPVPRLDA